MGFGGEGGRGRLLPDLGIKARITNTPRQAAAAKAKYELSGICRSSKCNIVLVADASGKSLNLKNRRKWRRLLNSFSDNSYQ